MKFCVQVEALPEALIPRGYPEIPDDGTWDNEGGFVGRRIPTVYRMEEPVAPWQTNYHRPMFVMDAETYAELELLPNA